MSGYPRRRITVTAFVLIGLGFALLRLPLDQKTYARESAKRLKGGKGGKGAGGSSKGANQKGGMVRLNELKSFPVNHDGSGAKKQVMILNGQVPHLTGFTRSVFAPGDEVETHSHKTMDEVFYCEEGRGVIVVDGTVVQLTPGTCVHVSAGQKHSLKNNGEEDMVLLFFGIAIAPAPDEGGSKGEGSGPWGQNALHAIGA